MRPSPPTPASAGVDPLKAVPPELANGRYSIQSVLGRGGMATVYKAWDQHLAVHRAIKVLSPELADRPAIRSRFLTEARAMARIQHRHVVAIQDVIDANGQIFIVMDLISGGTAWEKVQADGPWAERQACELVANIADAVHVAHEAGIVHRDIKPQNILLTEDGEGRLTDFGIARFEEVSDVRAQTRTGTVMGTWGFMPPEQRNDASRVEPRGDIYALAATLWALARGETPTDLFMADREPSMLDGFNPDLAAILMHATRYRAEDRYRNARELAAALRTVAGGLSSRSTGPVRVETIVPPSDEGSGHTQIDWLDGPVDLPSADVTIPDGAPPPGSLAERPRSSDASIVPLPAPPPSPTAPSERSSGRELVAMVLMALGLTAAVGTFAMVGLRLPTDEPPSPRIPTAPAAPPTLPVEETAPPTPEAGAPTPESAPVAPPSQTTAGAPVESSSRPEGSASPGSVDTPDAPSSSTSAEPAAASGSTAPSEAVEPSTGSGAPPVEMTIETTALPTPMGHVVATGDAIELWMRDDEGNEFEPGAVPSGEYTVYARFQPDQSKEVAARITVTEGVAIQLNCIREFQRCKAK